MHFEIWELSRNFGNSNEQTVFAENHAFRYLTKYLWTILGHTKKSKHCWLSRQLWQKLFLLSKYWRNFLHLNTTKLWLLISVIHNFALLWEIENNKTRGKKNNSFFFCHCGLWSVQKRLLSEVGFEPTPTEVDCDLNAAP